MLQPIIELGEIKQITNISPLIWEMDVYSPKISSVAQAGQFVHIRVEDRFIPFLRRPLSIGPITNNDTMKLIFAVRGEGTRLLSSKSKGYILDLIGPLGNPFTMPSANEVAILAAGGIGIVPLLFLYQTLPQYTERAFLLGMRSLRHTPINLLHIEHLNLKLASEDGSIGSKGTVIDILLETLEIYQNRTIVIYACGPIPMLHKIKEIGISKSIKTYLSLEVPMGCGIGACQSCAVARSDGNGYYLVCHDGPVFEAKDIMLNV